MALLRPRGWTVQIALLQPLAPAQDFEARAGSWRSKSWQWAEEGGGGFGLESLRHQQSGTSQGAA
jgi:hypothetical protein